MFQLNWFQPGLTRLRNLSNPPANRTSPTGPADADPNRALLDRRALCDLLGFDQTTYQAVRRLAAKWCAEPSVHGGKARPANATYVE